jgi:hypothetical protein
MAWGRSSVIGSSRDERKVAAYYRAQLAIKQAYERIDYDYDVIRPKLEEMRELAKQNNLAIEGGEEVEPYESDDQDYA